VSELRDRVFDILDKAADWHWAVAHEMCASDGLGPEEATDAIMALIKSERAEKQALREALELIDAHDPEAAKTHHMIRQRLSTTRDEPQNKVRVKRERETEKSIRAMDTHEIVALVHRLEDRIEGLRSALAKICTEYDSMYWGK
jgi:hypothetical protein